MKGTEGSRRGMGAHLATVLIPPHCGERRCLIADIKFDGAAVERRVVKSVSNLMMVKKAFRLDIQPETERVRPTKEPIVNAFYNGAYYQFFCTLAQP